MTADVMEIENFVRQFKMLWSSGQEAKLTLETKLGEVWINLNCKVGRIIPPMTPSPPLPPTKCKAYRSPSYYRRQARRRAERDSLNVSDGQVLTPVVSESLAEQADEAPCNVETVVTESDSVSIERSNAAVDEEADKDIDMYTQFDDQVYATEEENVSLSDELEALISESQKKRESWDRMKENG